ncbi:apolipoprotein N-acyltransferase [Rhodobacteraceae bacterium 2376]|uniref:Apolipoprotein N-acyltransferase n=2 Tax=Rhabdonatronobacter sediminivivens TaxID=2743469 RepID=A0A7Z0HY27_9RHOB|nr:apolipoprotein N-acyltransferase [Rhabdonatronobacter sediminivivens]
MAGALRRGAPFAAVGAVMATGQAPLDWWWATLLGFGVLLWLLPAARAPRVLAARLFATGCGFFAVSLNWIIHPFMVEPHIHGWMAPFALLAMAAGMALFWALAGAVAAWLNPGRWCPLALAVTMTAAEMLRGWLFGGFPWAMVGHAFIDTPVAQLAALAGAPGLSLLILTLAALPFLAQGQAVRAALAAAGVVLLSAGWFWGQARLAQPLPAPQIALDLRVVQVNAPQHLKWHPDYRWHFFQRHLEMTAAIPAPGDPAPDLVIWPETSVPFLLNNPGAGLDSIAAASGDAHVALGVQRFDNGGFFNSLALLDPDGAVTEIYDKHHLVPFGEYIPLAEALLGRGYGGFASQILAGYSAGAGPETLDWGRFGRVLPTICYESIFARHHRLAPRPDWILQVTNDAWFGNWSGPHQHLAQGRLRAVETGLPMVRAANTGISAVIDARGGIIASLPLNQPGVLDAALPGALPPPPYARLGDTPMALVLALLALAIGLGGRRMSRHPQD